jgi:hypothetical protein
MGSVVTIAMKDGSPSPVKSWVHFGCKRGPVCGDLPRYNNKGLWTLNPQPLDFWCLGRESNSYEDSASRDFKAFSLSY